MSKKKWNYKCPNCNEPQEIDWEKRNDRHPCPSCKISHLPLTPSQDGQAYVDTHRWPSEMERIVFLKKGTACTVAGCSRKADTLDHRIPYSKGGHTSVENLFPMCTMHNESKGEEEYTSWLISMAMKKRSH